MRYNEVKKGQSGRPQEPQKRRYTMAQANVYITCTECGKEFRHTKICYNRAAADSYEEWARENITTCPECYKAAKKAEEQATEEKALDGVELVELQGTEKQVAWANDIRRKICAECAAYDPKPAFWEAVNSKTTAKWWIDNRDSMLTPKSLAKLLMK